MFKKVRGNTRIDYYPKKASTVIDVGDALVFDESGYVKPYVGGKKEIMGVALQAVRSTDPDYAQTTDIEVEVEDKVEWEFETTGLAASDVGKGVGVSTSDPGAVKTDANFADIFVVKRYISPTRGIGSFVDFQNGKFVNSTNNYVTVGLGTGGDYNISSTAENSQETINGIAAELSAAGGGVLEVVSPGTFYVNNPVQLYSNVWYRAKHHGVSTFKYINNVTPTVKNDFSGTYGGGWAIILGADQSGVNKDISNTRVTGFIFDFNAQNMSPPDVTAARHRAMYIRGYDNFIFEFNEIKNPWNWCVDMHGKQDDATMSVNCWFHHNKLRSGWDTNDATKYVDGRQDGVDFHGVNGLWCEYNDIDTYGIQADQTPDGSGLQAQCSGDDGIVLRTYATDLAIKNVWINNNKIRSGSRGVHFTIDDQDISNVHVLNNIVEISSNSAYDMRTSTTGTGVFRDILYDGNHVVQAAMGTGLDAEGGAGFYIHPGSRTDTFFERVTIKNSKIKTVQSTAGTPAGYGISNLAKGDFLDVSGNQIGSGVKGLRCINLAANNKLVTNYKCDNNTYTQDNANGYGIVAQCNQKGTICGNVGKGNASALINIRVMGQATSGSGTYNSVCNNVMETWGTGIAEDNTGGTADYNIYVGNVMKDVTTEWYPSPLGTNSKQNIDPAGANATVDPGSQLNIHN